jgi:hypothetical protein
MADDTTTENVILNFTLKDGVSALSPRIQAALAAIGKEIRGLNTIFGGIGGTLGALGAGIGGFEVISKSLDAGQKMADATARLRAALGSNASQLQDVQRTAEQISKATTFSNIDVTNLAGDLLNREVPLAKLTETMHAAVDLAAALNIPLEAASRQLAASFGGRVMRDLGQAVPQLRNLSKEELALGGAVDIVEQKFSGQAEALAATPFGKSKELANQLENQYARLGDIFIKIENQILPAVIEQLRKLDDVLQSPAGRQFVETLGTILGASIKWIAAIGAITVGMKGWNIGAPVIRQIVSNLSFATAESTRLSKATATATAALENFRKVGANTASTIRQVEAAERALTRAETEQAEAQLAAGSAISRFAAGMLPLAGAAAGGYIGDQFGGPAGAILGALGGQALLSNPLGQAIAAGIALGDALLITVSKLRGINTQFDSVAKQIQLIKDIFANMVQHPGTAASDVWAGIKDTVEHPVDTFWFGRNPIKPTAADQAAWGGAPGQDMNKDRDDRLANIKGLADDYAKLMDEANDQVTQKQLADDIRANKAKLDSGVATLRQFVQERDKLETLPLEKSMHDLLAGTDAGGIHTAGIDDLNKVRESLEKLGASASKADQEKLIAVFTQLNFLQSRFNILQAQFNTLNAQNHAEAIQLAQQQSQKASVDLNRIVSANVELAGAGQLSPNDAIRQNQDALDQYQSKIQDIRSVLQALARSNDDVGIAAQQALKEIDLQADKTAADLQKVLADVRPLAKAQAEAAKQIQAELGKSGEGALFDIETKAKTGKAALLDMVQGLRNSLLQLANQRIMEQILGFASGGASGGGIFGVLGKGATPGTVGADAVIAKAGSWLFGAGSLFGAFASGGYTGDGSSNVPAGIVHKGEYVLPADTVKSMGGPDSIMQYLSGRMPTAGALRTLARSDSGASGVQAMKSIIEKASGDAQAAAQSQRPIIVPVAHVDDTAKAAFSSPTSAAAHYDMLASNQGAARNLAMLLKPHLMH